MNSLNSRTPTKNVWDKFRNITGNYKSRTIPQLETRKNIITSPDEITDTFADHYVNILRNPGKKSKSRKTRKEKSYHIINYSQTRTEKSHTKKEYSTWRGYNSSPDDKKTTTRDTEVLA